MVKEWTLSKIRNKARMSIFNPHIHHHTGSHSQWNKIINQRHSDWKGRNTTIFICTWQDCLYVDCQGIYKNALSKDTKSTHKNQLYFYISAMNNWEPKLEKQYHL